MKRPAHDPAAPRSLRERLTETARTPHGTRALVQRALVPVAILVAAAVTAGYLMQSGPTAERTPRPRQARLVEVERVATTDAPTRVDAMGTVLPARQVTLRPQVAGRVLEVAPEFIPGGRFERGETMLRIDPADYELAVRQRESDLAEARASLRIERGNQAIAQREYEILGETIREEDRELVLRQPQLETVRARVEAAEAALAMARLDLERTAVVAPFAALVRSRGVEQGTLVDLGTELATLVATDAYWIEASVPVSELRWLRIPAAQGDVGSTVRVYDAAAWGAGVSREGHVLRLLGDIESEGRMARVLIEVEDPLSRVEGAPGPALLLGSYARVEIEGRLLEDVVALDRQLLRDRDRVFVMAPDDTLEIRPVTVAYRGADQVLVSEGLREGDRVVRTDLGAPVAGMPLRTVDAPPAGEADAG